jgi:hypothetical protein
MLIFGTVSGLVVVVAVVLLLVVGTKGEKGSTDRHAAKPAATASLGPIELEPGEASVTVTAQGTRLRPQTARRQRGYATVLIRNETDGRRWIRIGGSSVLATAVGLLPHTQAENQVPLPRGRYRVSVRRPGEPYGDIGFLKVR